MEPTNREQRRHPEQFEDPDVERPPQPPVEKMLDDDRQQDDFDVRAKNSGHGKKTADKWNQ